MLRLHHEHRSVQGYFGTGGHDRVLQEFFIRFKRWASANQIEHHQPPFTSGMLTWDPYPSFNLKAHNGRVVLIFLMVCLRSALEQHPDHEELSLAAVAAQSLCAYYDRVERAGRYLSRAEADEICRAGQTFLAIYESLARRAASGAVPRWKIVPKHHAARS